MTSPSVSDRPLTQKQGAFCLFIFQGLPQREAYLKAGYSGRGGLAVVDTEASILMDSPKVSKRIAELRLKAESAAVMDVHERKARLSEVGRSNLTDFIDKDGNITLKPSAALAELVIEDWRNSGDDESTRTKRLKLRDPIAAIAELNKMERIGAQDNQLPANINIVFAVGKGYQNQEAVIASISPTPPG